jgi:hypothetical protein
MEQLKTPLAVDAQFRKLIHEEMRQLHESCLSLINETLKKAQEE